MLTVNKTCQVYSHFNIDFGPGVKISNILAGTIVYVGLPTE
jgi:hypothetical protein